jgi:diguanylate cyclase (GGDEF)-like protein
MSAAYRNRRGIPLALRLATLAAVPIVATFPFLWKDVRTAQATVEVADRVGDHIKLEQAVARVSTPAYVEGIAQRGLAITDRLKLDRQIVIDVAGIDYEAMNNANRVDLDEALDALAAEHGDLPVSPTETLGQALARLRLDLEQSRALTDQMKGEPEAVTALLEELEATLAAAVEAQYSRYFQGQNVPPELTAFRNQAHLMTDVQETAGAEATAMLNVLIDAGPSDLESLRIVRAVHDRDIEEFDETFDDGRGSALQSAAGSRPSRAAAESLRVEYEDIVAHPEYVRGVAGLLLEQIDYLRWLDGFAEEFYGRTGTSAAQLAADVRRERDTTAATIAALVLVSMLLTVLVSSSVLRPVRRLSRCAAEISAGQLDGQPLPARGPSHLRETAVAVNSMSDTLALLERQTQALAEGRMNDDSFGEVLPGSLGESVRASLARLASVTTQLHASEARASAIVEHAAVAIWTVDEHGVVVSANAAAEQILGTADYEQVGKELRALIGTLRGETQIIRADGAEVGLLVDHTSVTTTMGVLRTVVARDITERQEYERRLATLARHDALTGLPNRFAVLERLAEAVGRAGDGARVLFVDIDGFKSVNDSQGHAVGDLVLIEVARRLQAEAPAAAMAARLGGDEFLVVLEGGSDRAAIDLAERMIAAVEVPIRAAEQTFSISACVGIATTQAVDAPLDVVHRADSAVYKAKRRGRGRVEVFDEALQHALERQAELEFALRRGIADGELEMHLQPIFHLSEDGSDSVWGAEALVRWQRPGHGLVPPNDFVPVAEQSSLIFDVERWVLRTACQRAAAWRRKDSMCSLRIAVNISGRHLMDGELVNELETALRLSGADPTMIELELTESHLLADLDRARSVLDSIRAMGVTVAVDDFGTGFSSMSYLRNLPVDVIKVDRTFVSQAGADGFDSTVVTAMVNFGRVLDIDVVAEGVETEEQLDYVRSRGCNRAQGYLLARPLPVGQAEAVIFGQHAEQPSLV